MEKNVLEEIDFLSRKILDLNKQLIESEKAKSRFLSLVTSELNDPMTALLGLLPRLAPPEGDEKYKIFEMVHSEALTLELRIQNLVSAAEIESGEIDISYAGVSIPEIVKEVLTTLKYLIRTKKIEIVVKDTVEEKIVTDPRKLYIILTNLVANACMYGIEEGTVEIGFDIENSSIRIWVKNQGEGPKVQFKPQVFTRFAKGPEGE
ncbi:HAMP domain-containing sensor histidine kinase, partial [Sulfuricurvum sp.]|uniref:sensor histidine kinase n=1 Tax=Sulfuricurvum sp. TaxID=2025608 RepID=UPI002606F771